MGGLPGSPTGGADSLSPIAKQQLQQMQFNNIATGKPTYGGAEYALSALSNIGGGRGLIPAILGGLGQVYMANKANKAEQEALIQREMLRRGGQQSLADMVGIDPKYAGGLVAGEDATMQQALKLQQQLNAGQNSNNMINYLGELNPQMKSAPQIQGAVTEGFQNDYLQKLWHYAESLPGMEGQQLKNQIQQATMQSEIAGTNAKNTADARFAIPQAEANLQGTRLDNQGQAIDNRYAPQIKQNTIRNMGLQGNTMQQSLDHKSQAQALGLTLKKMQDENPDPVVFRGLGMDLLRRSNLPPEGIKAGMDSIDQMIIMQREADKARKVQAGQQVPGSPQQQPGAFGYNPR